MEVVRNYAKVHLDAERRTQTMAHEMWLEQSEMMKEQQIAMQDRLKLIVKQNRDLQEEVENLTRRNEKLSMKLRQFPERLRHPFGTLCIFLLLFFF